MKNYIILLSVFCFACNTNKSEDKSIVCNTLKNEVALTKEKKQEIDSEFVKFCEKFKTIQLPIKIENRDSLFKPYYVNPPIKGLNITYNNALKFLFNGNERKMQRKKGGYRAVYYGYKYRINEYVFLIYCLEESENTGLYVSVFDEKGTNLKEIYLSGEYGVFDPEGKRDAYIDTDGNIEITDIMINSTDDTVGTKQILNFNSKLEQIKSSPVQKIRINVDWENSIIKEVK